MESNTISNTLVKYNSKKAFLNGNDRNYHGHFANSLVYLNHIFANLEWYPGTHFNLSCHFTEVLVA